VGKGGELRGKGRGREVEEEDGRRMGRGKGGEGRDGKGKGTRHGGSICQIYLLKFLNSNFSKTGR